MSSYAHFFTEVYPNIRSDHLNSEGKVDSRAVAKAVGSKWNALSEDEKKVSDLFVTPFVGTYGSDGRCPEGDAFDSGEEGS